MEPKIKKGMTVLNTRNGLTYKVLNPNRFGMIVGELETGARSQFLRTLAKEIVPVAKVVLV